MNVMQIETLQIYTLVYYVSVVRFGEQFFCNLISKVNHLIIFAETFPSWHHRRWMLPMHSARSLRLLVLDYSNTAHYELCYMNTQSVLITLTQATLVHISRQSDSVVLNWWLVAQQGRRPWVRWHGTAFHHHHHRIFLVVKAQWADGWLR